MRRDSTEDPAQDGNVGRRLPWALLYGLPVALVVLLGASGLRFGLPELPGKDPDERFVVETSLATLGGDWSPHDFRYPCLFHDVLSVVLRGVALAMRWTGAAPDLDHLIARFDGDPGLFYVAARCVALLFGVLSAVATVLLVRRFASDATALCAGVALAASPLHVDLTQTARVDIALCAATTAALYFMARSIERGSRNDLGLAALCVGLATAAKYSGVILVPSLLGAGVLCRTRGDARSVPSALLRSATILAIAAAAFLVANPFVVGERARLGAALQMQSLLAKGALIHHTEAGWSRYPALLATKSVGIGVLAAACVGLVRFSIRRPRPGAAIILFAVPYAAIFGAARTAYPRYVLPLLPLLVLLAGEGIVATARRLGRPAWLIAAVALIPTLPPLTRLVLNAALDEDTRVQTIRFVEARVPAGALVIVGQSPGVARLRPAGRPVPPIPNPKGLRMYSEELQAMRERPTRVEPKFSTPGYELLTLWPAAWPGAARKHRPSAVVLAASAFDSIPEDLDYEVAARFRQRAFTSGLEMVVLMPASSPP